VQGLTEWSFHLTATSGNEFTCFGVCTLPITDSGYATSKSMWLVRAYNGQRYDRGTTTAPHLAPVRADSVVHLKVNLAERTLHIRVNDGPYELAFNSIQGPEVECARVAVCNGAPVPSGVPLRIVFFVTRPAILPVCTCAAPDLSHCVLLRR
jgi:hypothetical protein